jgi:hypothetical protein
MNVDIDQEVGHPERGTVADVRVYRFVENNIALFILCM